MSSNNVELVNGAYEAFGRGDIPGVLATFTDDVQWNVPTVAPHGESVRGTDAVASFFATLAETWEDFGIEVDAVIGGGDHVCGIGRAKGTLDGVRTGYGFVHVWTVRDGLCARFDEYVDPSTEMITRAAAKLAGAPA